jgi:hypothetical protein
VLGSCKHVNLETFGSHKFLPVRVTISFLRMALLQLVIVKPDSIIHLLQISINVLRPNMFVVLLSRVATDRIYLSALLSRAATDWMFVGTALSSWHWLDIFVGTALSSRH